MLEILGIKFVNMLLVVMIASLVMAITEHRKEMKETQLLKDILAAYDRSDKVIKDCVVYTTLPIKITGDNLSFISCDFKNIGKTKPDAALMKIMGLEA